MWITDGFSPLVPVYNVIVYIYNEKWCAEDHKNWSQKTYNVNIMLTI